MRILAFLTMIFCATGAFAQLPNVPSPVAAFVSSTGLSGSWQPLLSSGGISIPNVPSPAGLYCSSDGTGNAGTWVPCTPLTSGSPATAPAFIPQNTTAGPQQYLFEDFYYTVAVNSSSIGTPTGQGCSASTANANTNHPGQILITSGTGGTGTGDACFVGINASGDFNLNTSPGWIKESSVFVPVLPGTTVGAYQFGSSNSAAASPWTVGFGFYLSSANAVPNDWYCEVSTTYTDSTVAAVASTWTRLTLVSDGTNLHYYINGTQVCGTGTAISGIHAGSMPAGAWTVTALSGTSVTMGVDYLTSTRAVTR